MPREKLLKTISRTPRAHYARCKICHHPERKDIELDYIHYIPYPEICKRYAGVSIQNIHRHTEATGLSKRRDRKEFYNHIISNFDPSKVTAENAIEAAKQLDRIEHVVTENTAPSTIIVSYAWGKAMEKPSVPSGSVTDSDRLHTSPDAGKVPPQQEAV